MTARGTLLFVSPRFLFPVDSGGKIRTTQILRGLKGGQFRIRLLSPGSAELAARYRAELETVCDEFSWWPMPAEGLVRSIQRACYLLHELPMPVRSDYSAAAQELVAGALHEQPSVAVFDFLHAAVFAPKTFRCPTVLFTHNVEAEIFRRHAEVNANPIMRAIWCSQHRKMQAYERKCLAAFNVVVAVSDRDSQQFGAAYGIRDAAVIPTGVDLDFFGYTAPARRLDAVFCGSMDWLANQDAIRHFMDDIWPLVVRQLPEARMTVVGRAPPAALVEAARSRKLAWEFTGFVDDVRPVVAGAAVSVIPLRIGGGTRLKVYESMAMGAAVVSTTVGVEGLPVVSGQNCIVADSATDFAAAVVGLMTDTRQRHELADNARRYVEEHCGFAVAARIFEMACMRAIDVHASAESSAVAQGTAGVRS